MFVLKMKRPPRLRFCCYYEILGAAAFLGLMFTSRLDFLQHVGIRKQSVLETFLYRKNGGMCLLTEVIRECYS